MQLQSPDDASSRDLVLARELDALHSEREALLRSFQSDDSPLFQDLLSHTQRRLRLASDHRDMQLRHLEDDYRVQRLAAFTEYERGKRLLRADILALSTEKRRRIDQLRVSLRKKKRAKDRFAKRPRVRYPFLENLERQGMVRVSATPDEVNHDIECILAAIDMGKSNGLMRNSVRIHDNSKGTDRVLVSKNILHYYDSTFEKGDRVAVFAPRSNTAKSIPKYTGVLLAVNQKELTIRSNTGMLIAPILIEQPSFVSHCN